MEKTRLEEMCRRDIDADDKTVWACQVLRFGVLYP